MDISCSNCKYWHRLSEASGECRRRSPAAVAGETAARWAITTAAVYCWEWRPTEEASPKNLPGRPSIYTVEAVMEALSGMSPTDNPRSFAEVFSMLVAKFPAMSRTTAYKFLNALQAEGWLASGKGYLRASTPEEV